MERFLICSVESLWQYYDAILVSGNFSVTEKKPLTPHFAFISSDGVLLQMIIRWRQWHQFFHSDQPEVEMAE